MCFAKFEISRSNTRPLTIGSLFIALFWMCVVPSHAQVPEQITSTFGDWTVRCAGLSPSRACDLVQQVQDQKRQPVMFAAFSANKDGNAATLQVRLPVNVLLQEPVLLVVQGLAPVRFTWQSCDPDGCRAQIEATSQSIASLRNQKPETEAAIEFKSATAQPVKIPFSLRGLPQALDELKRQSIKASN